MKYYIKILIIFDLLSQNKEKKNKSENVIKIKESQNLKLSIQNFVSPNFELLSHNFT